MDEKEFIKNLSEGKKSTFFSFSDKYSIVLLKTISYVLNKPEDKDYIEECFDDVVMKILDKCNQFKFDCSFKVWIMTIAKHTALDYKRKIQKIYKNTELDESIQSDFNIEEDYISKEIYSEISKTINKLNPIDRELFIKKYILDLSTEELSQFYLVSENTIYKRLSRLRSKLKKLLKTENI